MSAKFDPKWMWDLFVKNRRQNAADHQFLQNNGVGYQLFDKILHILGNGFPDGKDGWNKKMKSIENRFFTPYKLLTKG